MESAAKMSTAIRTTIRTWKGPERNLQRKTKCRKVIYICRYCTRFFPFSITDFCTDSLSEVVEHLLWVKVDTFQNCVIFSAKYGCINLFSSKATLFVQWTSLDVMATASNVPDTHHYSREGPCLIYMISNLTSSLKLSSVTWRGSSHKRKFNYCYHMKCWMFSVVAQTNGLFMNI